MQSARASSSMLLASCDGFEGAALQQQRHDGGVSHAPRVPKRALVVRVDVSAPIQQESDRLQVTTLGSEPEGHAIPHLHIRATIQQECHHLHVIVLCSQSQQKSQQKDNPCHQLKHWDLAL